jgi:hypothetical protein
VLAAAYVAVLALAAPAGDERLVAVTMGVLVALLPSWPVATGIRAAVHLATPLPAPAHRHVLVHCLSFDLRRAIATRVQALGGGRSRWAAPFVAAFIAFAATLSASAFLLQQLGVANPGAGIAQASAVFAAWVFYRTLRLVKPAASALRDRDQRAPVVLLRRFADDALGTGKLDATTFEHAVALDLGRIGPAIAIGRPGERLQPLGASRMYLETTDDWQSAVRTLLDEAALVVVVLGGSTNVTWEFRTALGQRGATQVLVLVPPVPREDLERRWTAFVAATHDVLTGQLPPMPPDHRVLALWFTGDAPVVLVAGGRAPRQSWVARAWPEYRLLLRLREGLGPGDLASSAALATFLRGHLPFLTLEPTPTA